MAPKQFEPKTFRFKVRNPDGSDGHQAVVTWPHPSGENPALPKEPALSNPTWNQPLYANGDRAEMQVEAPSLDGRRVRFIVERHATGEKWDPVAEATAMVAKGRANATVELKGDQLQNPRLVREKGRAPVMAVDAPGIPDGREVEFTVETEGNGAWQPQPPAKGVVKAGKAEAEVRLPKGKHRFHAVVLPEQAEGNLRFRAELA